MSIESVFAKAKESIGKSGRFSLTPEETTSLITWLDKNRKPYKLAGLTYKSYTGDREVLLGETVDGQYVVWNRDTKEFGFHRTAHTMKDIDMSFSRWQDVPISQWRKQATSNPTGKVRPTGTCYRDAFRFVKQQPDSILVHGLVHSGNHHTKHAWVETDTGLIWEPQTNQFYSKAAFDRVANPIEYKRYTLEEAGILMLKTKHYGPWGGDDFGSGEPSSSSNPHNPDMLSKYYAKFPPGYFDDPIKSRNPLDYVRHVYINDIDIPSYSHWKDNWRYIPDPSEYTVAKYPVQVKVLADTVWQRLKREKVDTRKYLDAVSSMSILEYEEFITDAWCKRAEGLL